MGRQQTLVNKISFVTKGFIVSPTPAMQQVGISPAATVNNPVLLYSHNKHRICL